MRKSRFTEEQIVGVLHELEVGAKVTEVCRRIGVTETTVHRWRRKYGGLQVSEARRLRALEEEDRQLKRIVADQALNLQVVKISWEKVVTPEQRRTAITDAMATAGLPERRACRFTGFVRDVVVGRIDRRESEATRVHRDDWVYTGCPHSGPAVAVDSAGGRRTVWYTGRPGGAGVYLVRGNGDTGLDSVPVTLVQRAALQTAHPAVVALASGGTLAAWDLDAAGKRGHSVGLVRSGESRARTLAVPGTAGATYPQLAALGDSTVVVAWTEIVGDLTRVRLARIRVRQAAP
jgi:putative transposase